MTSEHEGKTPLQRRSTYQGWISGLQAEGTGLSKGLNRDEGTKYSEHVYSG